MSHGGGYTAELLLADADAALGALTGDDPDRAVTVLGRGLGAYIALQLAGSRPALVRGAILADGPGLAGGPTGPTSQSFFSLADRRLDAGPVRARSNSAATCDRPTTPPRSSGWRSPVRRSTSRSPCAP